MSGPALLEWLRPRRDEMVAHLRTYVEHETPSRDKPALDRLADVIAARWRALGGEVERIANPIGGDHLLAHFHFDEPADTPPAFVIGHFDTVWPIGTLEGMPFRVEDDRAYGPGTYDMKAGLVLIEYALAAIGALGLKTPRSVAVLFTSDEEIGSPTSRTIIEAQASNSVCALVLEGALPHGGLKTARKGVGLFTVDVAGRAAHAGVEPEKGASAIVELAHQILNIVALADPSVGTTLNVGRIQGGSVSNVIAASASARVDLRVTSHTEAIRVEEALRSLQTVTPGTSIRIEGHMNRPPMERTPAVVALYEKAREIGKTLDLDLAEGATGGASDANFTAAIGVPTLDGLGACGGGSHAEYEHVQIDSLPERAALLAALLLTI